MFQQTIITRFQDVKICGNKTFTCSGCGKKTRRQYTGCHTINPYNKNKEGEMKTYNEVYEDVKKDIEEWKKELTLCAKCENE